MRGSFGVGGSIAAMLLLGCGRKLYDPRPIDCAEWSEGAFVFESVESVAEINDVGTEEQPQLTRDGLTLYFARSCEIHRAVRPAIGAAFSAPTPVSGLSSAGCAIGGNITDDGLLALVMTGDGGPSDIDILLFERTSRDLPFSMTRVMTELSTPAADWDPFLTADRLQLYGAHVVPETADAPLWLAERNDPGAPFSSPIRLRALDVVVQHGNPSLTEDERIIVYNGVDGAGLSQLYYATRASRDAPFAGPRPIPGLAPSQQRAEPFVSSSGCEIFFNQPTDGSATERDLYRARYRRL